MLLLCGFVKPPAVFCGGGVGESVDSGLTTGESAALDGEEDVRGSIGDPSLLPLTVLSIPSSENPSAYISTASSTLISSSLISGQ